MTYKKYDQSPSKFNWHGIEYTGTDPELFIDLPDETMGCRINGFDKALNNEQFYPNYVDHKELFKAPDGGYILIAHLYDLHVDRNEHSMTQDQVDRKRKGMSDFADKYDLEVHFLEGIPSWYNDRCTMVLWKDASHLEHERSGWKDKTYGTQGAA